MVSFHLLIIYLSSAVTEPEKEENFCISHEHCICPSLSLPYLSQLTPEQRQILVQEQIAVMHSRYCSAGVPKLRAVVHYQAVAHLELGHVSGWLVHMLSTCMSGGPVPLSPLLNCQAIKVGHHCCSG